MRSRVAAVWVSILTSAVMAFLMLAISNWSYLLYEVVCPAKARPPISAWLHAASPAPYFFPVCFVVWAVVFSFRSQRSTDQAMLLCVSTLGTTLIFSGLNLLILFVPFVPLILKPMRAIP